MRRVLLVQPSSWRINTATTNYSDCWWRRDYSVTDWLMRVKFQFFKRETPTGCLKRGQLFFKNLTWQHSQRDIDFEKARPHTRPSFPPSSLFRHEDTLCRWCQNVAARNFSTAIIARQNSCWFVRKEKCDQWAKLGAFTSPFVPLC